MASSRQNVTAPDRPPWRPRPRVRIALSVVIAVHLFAVFVGPWAMPPSSMLAGSCARLVQPYLQAAYLDNGYRFFAPEPGPSHLIRYEITLADGDTIAGDFPNRERQRPRLLYHRYFMLTEFINRYFNPDAPRDDPRNEYIDAFTKSYAQHLAYEHRDRGVERVALFLRRHYVPRMDEVAGGAPLTEDRWYEEKPLGTFDAEGNRL